MLVSKAAGVRCRSNRWRTRMRRHSCEWRGKAGGTRGGGRNKGMRSTVGRQRCGAGGRHRKARGERLKGAAARKSAGMRHWVEERQSSERVHGEAVRWDHIGRRVPAGGACSSWRTVVRVVVVRGGVGTAPCRCCVTARSGWRRLGAVYHVQGLCRAAWLHHLPPRLSSSIACSRILYFCGRGEWRVESKGALGLQARGAPGTRIDPPHCVRFAPAAAQQHSPCTAPAACRRWSWGSCPPASSIAVPCTARSAPCTMPAARRAPRPGSPPCGGGGEGRGGALPVCGPAEMSGCLMQARGGPDALWLPRRVVQCHTTTLQPACPTHRSLIQAHSTSPYLREGTPNTCAQGAGARC